MSFASDFEPAPGLQPPHRGGRARRRLGAAMLLLVALALLAGIAAVVLSLTGSGSVKAGQPVTVTIPRGATSGQVTSILADKGVVSNATIFRARLRLHGDGGGFKSGTYVMKTGASYGAVVAQLDAGPPAAPVFTMGFPEGYRISEMAARVERDHQQSVAQGSTTGTPAFTARDYTAAVAAAKVPAKYAAPKGTRSMEGFLFPATYELRKTATAQQLVQKQLDAFAQNFDAIDMSAAKKVNLTPYEVVIIASMIEREARVPEERARIAGVIYNRLHARMALGIDATIQYAVDPNVWKTSLTKSDLAIVSPYNTRTNLGLPPTPIANPGLASLQAAANPEKNDYLYYVAKGDGSGKHYFTKSYADFLAHQH